MTDEQLSLSAQSGHEEALDTLLAKYKSLVNKIARKYFLVGGDMEDIVQEGMIGLYKAIKHYHNDRNSSFKTFARICISHQIQSAIKLASAEKNMILSTALPIAEKVSHDDEEEEEIEIVVQSNLPTPDDKLLEKEKMQELVLVIKKVLSPLELKILSLYLKGYSYNEIAQMANVNKKSIDNGLSRIKNKLSFLKEDFN